MKKEKTSSSKSSKISVVFFGSGPVAAESLRLVKQEFHIEVVVTKPTTRAEMVLAAGNSPVHCVSDKEQLNTLFTTENFDSAVGLLIDFGIIVSNKIIDYFPKGIVNSHFSLLPELRGADPISFAILEGKQKTGVSLMLLVEAMDEGPILAIGVEQLDRAETAQTLTEKLIHLSYVLLSDTMRTYMDNKSVPVDQELLAEKMGTHPSYTRKLTKQDGVIDWNKSAMQIEREVRAYVEWPKSRATFGDIDCVITKAQVIELTGKPGKLLIHDKNLAVYCGQKALIIELLKPAGKKEMTSQAFLAGYKNRLDI